MSDCIFCKIASGEIKSEKLYDDGEVFCVRDLHPMSPTHLLLIPHKHIDTLMDVTAPDLALIGKVFKVAQEMAKRTGVDQSGFRIIHNVREWGGQRIFHIHFHLLGGKEFKDH